MSVTVFCVPCLTVFCQLDEPGLAATGQLLEPGRTVTERRVVADDRASAGQGVRQGVPCGGVAHGPLRGPPHHAGGHRTPSALRRMCSCVAPGHRCRRARPVPPLTRRAGPGARGRRGRPPHHQSRRRLTGRDPGHRR